jgi:hypothetical protein
MADFRHRVVEAAAAVADVEHHAALLGRQRRGQQLAVLDDVGELAADVGRAGVGMGQHVAGTQVSRIWLISSGVSTPPMWHITLPRCRRSRTP